MRTFRLWVCRSAWTTFGISFSISGLSVGWDGNGLSRLGYTGHETYDEVFVQFLALALLAALETEDSDLLRDTERCATVSLISDSENALRTIEVEIVHGGNVGLGLASDEANAVWLATVTWLRFMTEEDGLSRCMFHVGNQTLSPVSVDIVVEREFLVLLDVPVCEDPHAHVMANCPFCYIAIRVAAVVRETPDTASFCSVNELLRSGLSDWGAVGKYENSSPRLSATS